MADVAAPTAPVLSAPQNRKRVRIAIARFWAGAAASEIVDTLLPDLKPYFDFEISDDPQVLLYGPYAGGMPKGRFTKVFIGCENLRPIMSECDWAFGVEHEDHLGHPRYMRIARWGDDAPLLTRNNDWERVLRQKTRFCAFVFSNSVFYREAFCRALSCYKPVDAPGRSLNNMSGIDPVSGPYDWQKTKVEFLRNYKFVIAFENSSRPGYNTEKLTHPVQANCLPIYWGDPEIVRVYNPKRFVYANEYLPKPRNFLPRMRYRPHSVKSAAPLTFAARAARRFNGAMSALEQRVWRAAGFDALIERIVAIDRDDELYLRHLREPLLIGNRPPDRSRWIARWRQIFAESLG